MMRKNGYMKVFAKEREVTKSAWDKNISRQQFISIDVMYKECLII